MPAMLKCGCKLVIKSRLDEKDSEALTSLSEASLEWSLRKIVMIQESYAGILWS